MAHLPVLKEVRLINSHGEVLLTTSSFDQQIVFLPDGILFPMSNGIGTNFVSEMMRIKSRYIAGTDDSHPLFRGTAGLFVPLDALQQRALRLVVTTKLCRVSFSVQSNGIGLDEVMMVTSLQKASLEQYRLILPEEVTPSESLKARLLDLFGSTAVRDGSSTQFCLWSEGALIRLV